MKNDHYLTWGPIINTLFISSFKLAHQKAWILFINLSHNYRMTPHESGEQLQEKWIGLGFMFYLELEHGPSYVGVEQQTVGSYTGAWITCIFNRDLHKNNSASQNLGWD